ncbi:hypothetical protein BAY61_26725 [Prauserella marina]|uniref:Uncharacterized protein n=1 Tax=Prauserella marina TaxID=530584 RepID=A0A222VVU8_9PSEU|nr:hypothetical protein [Prauserella marina]ASR38010.1 hypothetical protein BAY61_26725 [Prauserella marina]PWV73242.1 hypothetical protein DES30_109192 [Prauserella marina]SDD68407.1 hypothetical protein SAMN05421630_11181 [Prauserella marina]
MTVPPHSGQPDFDGSARRKRKRGISLRQGLPVVIVVAGLLIFGATRLFGDDVRNAEAGDCIYVAEYVEAPSRAPAVVDCGEEKANAKVAVTLSGDGESCPSRRYDQIHRQDGNTLCLMINAKDGDCFANISSPTEAYTRVACTDPSAELEVVKVVADTTDPDVACANTKATDGIVYPEPETVMCIAQPTAA